MIALGHLALFGVALVVSIHVIVDGFVTAWQRHGRL